MCMCRQGEGETGSAVSAPKKTTKKPKPNTPTYLWLEKTYGDHPTVKELNDTSLKQKQAATVKKLKEWMDFIYPLYTELPITDYRKNSISDRYEKVTKAEVCALVNRGKSWVDAACYAMQLLQKLDLNSERCHRLKQMIDGEIEEVYGIQQFVKFLQSIPAPPQ